jgi:hypothetical protein
MENAAEKKIEAPAQESKTIVLTTECSPNSRISVPDNSCHQDCYDNKCLDKIKKPCENCILQQVLSLMDEAQRILSSLSLDENIGLIWVLEYKRYSVPYDTFQIHGKQYTNLLPCTFAISVALRRDESTDDDVVKNLQSREPEVKHFCMYGQCYALWCHPGRYRKNRDGRHFVTNEAGFIRKIPNRERNLNLLAERIVLSLF